MFLPLLLALAAPARAAAAPAPAPVAFTGVISPRIAAVVAPGLPLRAPLPFAPEPGGGGGGAAGHRLASAAEAGLSLDALLHAEQTVVEEIARGGFPGAALAAGRRGYIVVERGLGYVGWEEDAAEVSPDETVYDLASLTKVVATTTAAMLLVEDGKLELDAPVQRYLPEFGGWGKERVTIRHLLTHTAGLPAGTGLWGGPTEALTRALATPLQHAPGAVVEYSDVGFVVLWAAAQRAAGAEPLYRLLDRRVYGPLGMRATTFQPGERCPSCAPTARRGDGSPMQGRVHDPIAARLGGIAGNAGLFSTAHDLARFAAMLANGGELEGVRVLRPETIRLFAQRQVGAGTRALGWDTPSGRSSGAAGLKISPRGFGHTGFTGTSLWVDPDRGTWVVLLANRTYQPLASNRIQAVRRAVHDWVAVSADNAMLRHTGTEMAVGGG